MGCGCKKNKDRSVQPPPQTPDELLNRELKEWNNREIKLDVQAVLPSIPTQEKKENND